MDSSVKRDDKASSAAASDGRCRMRTLQEKQALVLEAWSSPHFDRT